MHAKKILLFIFLPFLSLFTCAEEIIFSADSMTGTAGSKSDTTTLSGSAAVQTPSMQINADLIELSGEDYRFITATGNVSGSISESQMDFSCGKLKYDRSTKIAQLEDSVHLIDKPNDVTADAQIIEYNQENNTAVMQIEITLKQKNNVCTGTFAIYKKGEQLLELSGNPQIVQGSDNFRAQEIILNLQTQEITLDGRVKGSITDSKPAAQNDSAAKEGSQTEQPQQENTQNDEPPAKGETPSAAEPETQAKSE